jgi:hypothetical protein
VKLAMIKRFNYLLIGVYVAGILAISAEFYFKFTAGMRDDLWRYEWLVESSWYIIFSVFFLAVMILMRPNSKSRMLAYVEELSENE